MSSIAATAIAAGSTAAALGLLAGGAAYASRWPTSQIFGRTLIDAPEPSASGHTVWLTYDDGPSDRNTPALLDILAAKQVKATFFLIGNHVRRHPALARRIADEGHTIGNHTDMHPALARESEARIRAEFERCQQAIADASGIFPALFRPPYGSRRPAVLRIARELGLTPVLWNVTARDWASLDVEAVLSRIDNGMEKNRKRRRTSNVLLHDASHLDGVTPHLRATTLAVTEALLARPGLEFSPVPIGS